MNTKIATLVNNFVNQIKSIKGLPTESSVTESKKEVVEEPEKSLSSEKTGMPILKKNVSDLIVV